MNLQILIQVESEFDGYSFEEGLQIGGLVARALAEKGVRVGTVTFEGNRVPMDIIVGAGDTTYRTRNLLGQNHRARVEVSP